jgi:RHS repeat-associated protein
MAMSVVYSNFCGRVVSETRGGVESDYVSDPLGSTIGLMNSAGTMTDRWEYWPYGEVVSRSGSNPTPLTWLGVIGYFQDVLSKLFYVRARHLRADLARWLTRDPLWPSEMSYGYADCSPVALSDLSGMIITVPVKFKECGGKKGNSCLAVDLKPGFEYCGVTFPFTLIAAGWNGYIRLYVAPEDSDKVKDYPMGGLAAVCAFTCKSIICGGFCALAILAWVFWFDQCKKADGSDCLQLNMTPCRQLPGCCAGFPS